MKVSLNTANNKIPRFNSLKKPKKDKIEELKTSKDFLDHRTRVTIGSFFLLAVGIDILYFTMKRNMKYDKIAKAERLLEKKLHSLENAPITNIRF